MKSDKTTDLLTEVAVIDSDRSLSNILVVLSAQLKSMSGLCWHSLCLSVWGHVVSTVCLSVYDTGGVQYTAEDYVWPVLALTSPTGRRRYRPTTDTVSHWQRLTATEHQLCPCVRGSRLFQWTILQLTVSSNVPPMDSWNHWNRMLVLLKLHVVT